MIKNLINAYDIKHIVCVQKRNGKEAICIGSPYISDIIVIGMDGTLIKPYKTDSYSPNEDLVRYMKEFTADPEKLKRIVQSKDTFEKLTSVWIYEKNRIFKKQCENVGYPYTTTDGVLMYNNTTFTTKKEALLYARQSNKIEWRYLNEVINWKRIKFFFESLADFIYIRIIQPFKQ